MLIQTMSSTLTILGTTMGMCKKECQEYLNCINQQFTPILETTNVNFSLSSLKPVLKCHYPPVLNERDAQV